MKNSIYLTIVLVLVAGAGAFYGGMKYQQSKTPAFAARFAGAGFQGTVRTRNGQGGGNGQGGFVSGQILSIGSGSLTVQLPNNGGSKIVLYSSSTPLMKSVEGTASDLKTGENVVITGTTNSDGSVTAQSLQLRNQPQQGQAPTAQQAGQ